MMQRRRDGGDWTCSGVGGDGGGWSCSSFVLALDNGDVNIVFLTTRQASPTDEPAIATLS